MVCPQCKQELPEDSLFCQYCGATLAEKKMEDFPSKNEAVKSEPADVREKVKSEKVRSGRTIALVLLCVLVGVNVFLLVEKNRMESTYKDSFSAYRSFMQSHYGSSSLYSDFRASSEVIIIEKGDSSIFGVMHPIGASYTYSVDQTILRVTHSAATETETLITVKGLKRGPAIIEFKCTEQKSFSVLVIVI